MTEPTEGTDPPGSSPGDAPKILSAELFCDNCGRETPHRILRLDRSARPARGRVAGTARCRECRWTHPFESVAPTRVEVTQIVSEGHTSTRTRIALPAHRRVQVGTGLPDSPVPVLVRRIDTQEGQQVTSAVTDEIATVWVTRDVGAVVKVSLVLGRLTRTSRLVVPPETPFTVGDRVTVEGIRLEIVALRARGQTWRRPGDTFPAGDVQRLYGRRRVIPPAGRSDWRRVRETPSSLASSTSRAARSRSSPGVRSTRTAPRARTALGGAQVHRSSFS
jgi:uncharacterized Zn finger protein